MTNNIIKMYDDAVEERRILLKINDDLDTNVMKKKICPDGNWQWHNADHRYWHSKVVEQRAEYLLKLKKLNHTICRLESFKGVNIALYKKLPKYMVMEVCNYLPMVQPDLTGLCKSFTFSKDIRGTMQFNGY